MKRSYTVILLFLSVAAASQHAVERFSFYSDYSRLSVPNSFSENYEQTELNLGGEIQIAEYVSLTLDHYSDYNGYQSLMPIWGAPLNQYDRNNIKWGTKYTQTYGMLRLYTLENYHSQALQLRDKEIYGFYFSFGYAVQRYTARNWTTEQFVYYDEDLEENRIGSYIDKNQFWVSDRGVQFGFGFKMFHSKYLYTDASMISSAYSRNNRKVWSSIYPDIRRYDNGDPFEPVRTQEEMEEFTFVWAKNGRGILFRFLVGVNLDFNGRR